MLLTFFYSEGEWCHFSLELIKLPRHLTEFDPKPRVTSLAILDEAGGELV